MTSEKRAQKFHTDDVSLPRSGQCSFFWLILPRGKFASTNQATVNSEEKKRNHLSSIPFFFSQTALVDFADATLVSRTTLFILNENSGFLFNHDTLEFLHYTTPLATEVSKYPLKRGGGKSEVKMCNTVNPTYKNLSGWNFHFKQPSHRTISGWNFKVGS